MEKFIAQSGHEANGIIIGMVLGDSSILYPPKCRNARLSTFHSSRSADYLAWKMNALCSYLEGTLKFYSDDKESRVYWISPVDRRLNYHEQDFYKDSKKIVKRSVLNRLTPAGLACWYMDDGSLKMTKGRFDGIQLATNCFDAKSLDNIVSWFQEAMGLKFTISSNKAIYSDTASGWRFLGIVKPYVDQVESMRYKADLGRFKLESARALTQLPKMIMDRLVGVDKSVMTRGYVWQVFPKSTLWPPVLCKECGKIVERKIASIFCSQRCGIWHRKRVKDIVRSTGETSS